MLLDWDKEDMMTRVLLIGGILILVVLFQFLMSVSPETPYKTDWVKGEVVKTVYAPGQSAGGVVMTTSGPGVVIGGSGAVSQVFYTLPDVGDGRKIYTANVDPATLFEAERDRIIEVKVRNYENSDTPEVFPSDIRIPALPENARP
ncbi:hypothetical protein K9692_004745 [Escherichia coli]|jgi:hypothetical protein|uniref:hypothetical protein n=1 Tax=Buttiauxella gaviniae TaxID=82990 RepID=UPI0015E552B3|nr:hypothetical protein [Citrobacter freundii]EIC1587294.1 hypothetical protein [Escherichia coli]QLO06694.1 hypothetical protein HV141_24680 [Citrobacter freundii]